MDNRLTPVEMFNELVQRGYIVPAASDPIGSMIPTAYISVPTAYGYTTPPISLNQGKQDAKLGSGPKRNSKRKGRSRG